MTDERASSTQDVPSKALDLRGLCRKWFRRDNLIVMILAGVLLFIIALPTKKEDAGAGAILDMGGKADAADVPGPDAVEAAAGSVGNAEAVADYAAWQEEKLAALLSAIDGVGRVEVMLTFWSSEELVVEKDAPTVRSNTVEKDSEGGTRTVTQFEMGDSTVYQSSSGVSAPYVVKTLNPRVEGVLVVAEGAGDGAVNSSITQIAQALFGVEAHRVVVMPMGGAGNTGEARRTASALSGS